MRLEAAEAFCPAHVTGFFKAHIVRDAAGLSDQMRTGSTGAGFSLAAGVTTRVVAGRGPDGAPPQVVAAGRGGQTSLLRCVVKRFLRRAGVSGGVRLGITHKASVPAGCGLGSSGAAALSLAYALDGALGTGLAGEEIGRIAHAAEIDCGTGLGDVLASYHGGFEIRTVPGAPGVGRVETIPAGGITAVVLCLAPVSTSRFLRERLPEINGLGGAMTDRLRASRDYGHFQSMSLEFAKSVGVVTPRMRGVIDELDAAGIGCGVALFGETIFCMGRAGSPEEEGALKIFGRHPEGVTVRSGLDEGGARLLRGCRGARAERS